LGRKALGPAEKAHTLCSGGFDVDELRAHFNELGDLATDLLTMGTHLWRFAQNGHVCVANAQSAGAKHVHDVPDEAFAVSSFPTRIGILEMLAYVAQTRSAQKSVAQRMKDDIAIGMGDHAPCVRNAYAAKHHEFARPKRVYVSTLSNSHFENS